MLDYEDRLKKKGYQCVIGIDEAGRGPLAGPVVASAVVLHTKRFKNRIDDSKKMNPQEREEAFFEIYQKAYVGVGIMSEAVIDEINILQATFRAMSNAVEDLMYKLPEERKEDKVCLLVDGNRFKSHLTYDHKTIIDGDAQVFSIACASIVAKVTRDRILNIYDKVFPQYGFRNHKGYCTATHRERIKEHGLCLIHRRTFQISEFNVEEQL
jgi:ribonuclease HII